MKPLLEKIGPDLSSKLRKLGHARVFGDGEEIFSSNEEASYLPIVIAGRVKMVHILENGKEVIVGIFEKGEMFAVPPVFDGLSYPASAFAMEKTKLLTLPRPAFLALLKESSEFSFAVIDWMCEMLREKTATIQNLARTSPERRIAAILIKLAGDSSPGDTTRVNIRRQDIAEMTNLTTETVIRATKRLEEKDLVQIVRGKIVIDDVERLRRFLG